MIFIREKNRLYKADEWDEEMGDCLFFHMENFSGPPSVLCGSPLDYAFTEAYWTHFIRLDFNHLFKQAHNQE